MRRILLLLISIFTVLHVRGDGKLTFTTNAPDVVVEGDQFRLSFTVNSLKVKEFRAPNIKDFDVLMGPTRSEQSSSQLINGKQTFSQSITFTYILMAKSEGTFSIPGATIMAEGQSLRSNSVTIRVLPPDKAGNTTRGNSSGSGNNASSGSKISNTDLFIVATASKTNVYEQEAILLTYKVYTVVDLRSLHGDMPDMKDFHTQEVDLPRQKQFTLEHYNGRNYNTTIWSQYILYPQRSGKLEIPSITFEGEVIRHIESIDPFDAFFNGTNMLSTVKKNIVTPKVVISVKELPAEKPEGFSGGVGAFIISSSISTQQLKTNDAVTVKLIISGTGNMKLMETPEVKFPQDFEVYDPKVDNNYNLTREGLSGSKVIEYLAIPRHAGNFTIPPIEFSYFDLKANAYKTLKTQPYKLNVEKGEGNADQVIADFTNKENLKIIGSDIRYIKTGSSHLSTRGDFFFGSVSYYLWYFIPFVVFILSIIICRKQALANANIAKVRTKKANKVATKRLKNAGKLYAANKQNEFYDELLKALWGYTGDKLNIPVSELSKDNIEERLAKRHVAADLIKEFVAILNDAEFARYAPGDPGATMGKEYQAAIDVISKMESSIKHERGGTMKTIYLIFLLLSAFLSANAQTVPDSVRNDSLLQRMPVDKLAADVVPTKAEADSAYFKGNYADAIALYEGILKRGKESSELYYNLGNSYYKSKDMAKAILNYERALLLNPGDGDIKFNLKLAQNKTVDNIVPVSEIFLVTWIRSLTDRMGEKGWAKIALASFILALAMIALYIFSQKVGWKKIGFVAAVILVAVCIFSNVFASIQKSDLVHREDAIIMSPSVTARSTPNESGTELFILHEGTKVRIKDNTMKEWKEVQLEDGNVGWIPANTIEVI